MADIPSIDDISSTIKPGDVVLVHYKDPDFAQAGIEWAENGPAEHALCCLGGLDLVEADTIGIIKSNLWQYLKGNCILTLKRVNPNLSYSEKQKVTKYWLKCVGQNYDFGMIVGMLGISIANKTLGIFSKKASNWASKHIKNIFAHPNENTCDELWVRGIRLARPNVLKGYPFSNCTPQLTYADKKLLTVAQWKYLNI